jgi:hypothetical protein
MVAPSHQQSATFQGLKMESAATFLATSCPTTGRDYLLRQQTVDRPTKM